MSDTSQGPGWWQASDEKWYPPDLYPADWPRPEAAVIEEPIAEPSAPIGPAVMSPSPTPGVEPAMPGLPPLLDADAAEAAQDTPPTWALPTTPETPTWAPAATDAPGWPSPASEPTLVQGVVRVPSDPVSDPTSVQPAVGAPVGPPSWDTQPPTFPSDVAFAPSPRAKADVPSAVLAVLGAGAMVVGSFLEWASGTGAARASVSGISGSNGPGTLAAGIAALVLAALLFLGRRAGWVGGLLAAAGAAGLGLAVFSIADISSVSDDLPGKLEAKGYPAEQVANAGLDLSPGIWIVAAGAAVVLVAGVIALVRRSG